MEDRQMIASRLRQAREAAGLTQAEVAAVLGLPRPSVSQIEAGERAVRSEELNRLAQLYGKPVTFFLEPKEAEEDMAVLFRAPNVLEEDKAPLERGLVLCQKHHELEQILGLESGEPIQFMGLPRPRTKGEAIRHGEFVAKKARDLLELGSAPIEDLAGLLELHGVKVIPCLLRDEVSGAFVYSNEIGPCIFVNARHRQSRQNFTLAHEYCHTLLDWERRAHLDLTEFSKDPVETRADVFAAGFLMPSDALAQFLERMGITTPKKHAFDPYDVARIAAHFNASHLAVLWRLYNLGYVDAETREALQEGTQWKQVVTALGVPDTIDDVMEAAPTVTPERLRDMAVEAYRQGRISLGKLAEYLGMTLSKAKTFVHKAQIEPEDHEGEQ